ncbi:MAG: hypothetical protein A3F78_05805 [Burkholderiales bacterium RIFCSPLOWO2_12_FULL_61_40]|nr:MAG: hypothetical protein A3F78_05805 [Burkholderiales bacterium RIFCSPLOWO2_12_FULL_61_40]
MPDSTPVRNTAQVAARLAREWELLSGESRVFDLVAAPSSAPPLAEFSYLMPLTLFANQARCGLGVLIQRKDALTVAANMFGVLPHEIPDEDLKDACSEVCNVFSDCIAMHLSGNEDVSIGLPLMLEAQNYEKIYRDSVVTEIYQSCVHSTHLLVVVFDSLCQLP